MGKADAWWEETSTCTTGDTGVRDQAPGERFVEITSGRAYFQPGLTATGEDCESERRQRGAEDLGLSHESI